MKIILPLAGLGSRMRPQTWSRPKPLLNIAGKTVLAHVLDTLETVGIDEVIFIIGYLGDQIKEYVDEHYDFPARYVVQDELKGQAHAIYLAKEYIEGPCMVVWVDTLFKADLTGLEQTGADFVAFIKETEDPRRFGVAVTENGRIVRIIEKPDTCEYHDVVVGVYYIAEGKTLIGAIDYLLEHGIKTKGEFYLADALQVMLNQGAHAIVRPVEIWEDCGKPDAMLQTHRYLLNNGHDQVIETENSVIIPPVHLVQGACITNSIIGPYVTIAQGAQITGSILQNAIVDEDACIENAILKDSLIGQRAQVKGYQGQINLGDDTKVNAD